MVAFPGGLLGLLTVIFIILKVAGVIAWSWFWVLFPMIVLWAFVGGVMLFAFAVLIIAAIGGD